MLHIHLDKGKHHAPYSRQILEQIRQAILAGQLSAGVHLPPTRQLAVELGISRRTVVLAYEELCLQGYCTSKVGSGTVVAQIPVLQQRGEQAEQPLFTKVRSPPHPVLPFQKNDSNIICFAPSLPQTDYLPLKSMRQAFQAVLDQARDEFKGYQKSKGHQALIQAIRQHILPTRGIQAEPDQVLITHGSQHASTLLSTLLAASNEAISYGEPGYLPIVRNFTLRGMTGIPCTVDEEGICLSEQARSAHLHYVMPEHHFPQSVTLSPNRRASLLQLAEDRNALILEDDYDSEFYYDRHPLPALKAEDLSHRVIYMGTFSKTLFSGVRLGYIVAHPEIIECLMDILWRQHGGINLIMQLWAAELINSGAFGRHLRRMRVHYRKKRDLIAAYLKQTFPDWYWRLPHGGMQFWIRLPPDELAAAVIARSAQKGVGFWSGAEYYEHPSEASTHSLILGFGPVAEPEIHQAFARLATTC